jgi:hypothetical protein
LVVETWLRVLVGEMEFDLGWWDLVDGFGGDVALRGFGVALPFGGVRFSMEVLPGRPYLLVRSEDKKA